MEIRSPWLGGVARCHLQGLGMRYDTNIKILLFFRKLCFSMRGEDLQGGSTARHRNPMLKYKGNAPKKSPKIEKSLFSICSNIVSRWFPHAFWTLGSPNNMFLESESTNFFPQRRQRGGVNGSPQKSYSKIQ